MTIQTYTEAEARRRFGRRAHTPANPYDGPPARFACLICDEVSSPVLEIDPPPFAADPTTAYLMSGCGHITI